MSLLLLPTHGGESQWVCKPSILQNMRLWFKFVKLEAFSDAVNATFIMIFLGFLCFYIDHVKSELYWTSHAAMVYYIFLCAVLLCNW